MNDVINIKDFQKKKKVEKFEDAEYVTKEGVSALLHSLHANNFPIDDPDFQHDLASVSYTHLTLPTICSV